jgi:hypothetical protein
MNTLPSSSRTFLGRALLADGVVSGATGALMFLAASPLSELLGLPTALLRIAGFSLLPYAAFVLFLGMRHTVSRTAVWAVVGINLMWAADSLLLLATGWVAPTALGYAFVVFQALAVAAFAGLQYIGMRPARAVLA